MRAIINVNQEGPFLKKVSGCKCARSDIFILGLGNYNVDIKNISQLLKEATEFMGRKHLLCRKMRNMIGESNGEHWQRKDCIEA